MILQQLESHMTRNRRFYIKKKKDKNKKVYLYYNQILTLNKSAK